MTISITIPNHRMDDSHSKIWDKKIAGITKQIKTGTIELPWEKVEAGHYSIGYRAEVYANYANRWTAEMITPSGFSYYPRRGVEWAWSVEQPVKPVLRSSCGKYLWPEAAKTLVPQNHWDYDGSDENDYPIGFSPMLFDTMAEARQWVLDYGFKAVTQDVWLPERRLRIFGVPIEPTD